MFLKTLLNISLFIQLIKWFKRYSYCKYTISETVLKIEKNTTKSNLNEIWQENISKTNNATVKNFAYENLYFSKNWWF